ncbi:hypothetical protein FIBSPDRAFT_729504, partial [Athelia psychrophila]
LSTAADNQSIILIQVFEGECPLTNKNNHLGKVELNSVPLVRVPHIEVTFGINTRSIMSKAGASGKGTSNSESIMIAKENG